MPRRLKDFKGCLQCRTRKVKCDGKKPRCENCRRLGKRCPGFDLTLKWLPPNTETSKIQGRGGGQPASCTWRNWVIENLETIEDRLLALEEYSQPWPDDSKSITSFFSVLKLGSGVTSPIPDLFSLENEVCKPLVHSVSDWTAEERRLLDHYVKEVAPQMMPFNQFENPWATHYTSMALQSHGVRNALLSQAAAHWWNLCGRPSHMEIDILKYHSKALAYLRGKISEEPAMPFEEVLAIMLSLIMVDVYYGHNQQWRYHFRGAVQYVASVLSRKPWEKSEMAWLVSQSLCMLVLRTRIDGSTTQSLEPETDILSCNLSGPLFLNSIDVRSDFGFTLGASRGLVKCLSACADLISTYSSCPTTRTLNSDLDVLTHKLSNFMLGPGFLVKNQTEGERASFQALHDHIFASGLLIVVNRKILDPWPVTLHYYSLAVLDGLERFVEACSGATNFGPRVVVPTIWPIFHAAIELYREQDQCRAKSLWLNHIEGAAIGNRQKMRTVLERVWKTRKQSAVDRVSSALSADSDVLSVEDVAGKITVDWRSVAEREGIDLLLV